jgi:hypothetical protein
MTAPAGSIAATVASRNRRRIIKAFRKAAAVSPETARTLEDIGVTKSPLLKMMKARGVLVEVDENRFYLDEQREQKTRQNRRLWIYLLVMVIVVVALYFKWF